jgi:hypothetical protein
MRIAPAIHTILHPAPDNVVNWIKNQAKTTTSGGFRGIKESAKIRRREQGTIFDAKSRASPCKIRLISPWSFLLIF